MDQRAEAKTLEIRGAPWHYEGFLVKSPGRKGMMELGKGKGKGKGSKKWNGWWKRGNRKMK